MNKTKQGTISIPPGSIIEKHEKITADYLALLGYDIAFIVPNRSKGTKTPDILMDGFAWEVKCPQGRSSRTIENNLRVAMRQSPYIVFDLRRMDRKIPTIKLVSLIMHRFQKTKLIKRLIIITPEESTIDLR